MQNQGSFGYFFVFLQFRFSIYGISDTPKEAKQEWPEMACGSSGGVAVIAATECGVQFHKARSQGQVVAR